MRTQCQPAPSRHRVSFFRSLCMAALLFLVVACANTTSPSSSAPPQDDSGSDTVQGDSNPGDTAPTEVSEDSDNPETQSDASEDTTPPPPGIEITGCDELSFELPLGQIAVRIEPANLSLKTPYDVPATADFQVIATLEDESEITINDAIFVLPEPGLGTLSSDGHFESLPGFGGQRDVQALIGDVCISTTLSVTTEFHLSVGTSPTDLPTGFGGNEAPNANENGPHLLYPLDGAAWPANLPPMTLQWRYEYGGPSTVFRIGFEAPYANVYVYGTGEEWAHSSPNGYVATIPTTAWEQVFALSGGSPHAVQVTAGIASEDGVANLAPGIARTVHFTEDLFGGAVYYWNTAKQGIRVVELQETPPIASDIAIPGGCHGCHAASPDGSTIAITYNVGLNPGADGQKPIWSMQLHNVEDGAQSDWVHPDAEAYLASAGSMYPAFSNAYWTETKRHVLMTHGTPPTVNPLIRRLISVDLLSGTVQPLTSEATPALSNVQLFPAFARNGEFVIFTDAENAGKGGLNATDISTLWRMPYNGGLGAIPEPLTGGADTDLLNYYPSITPDDQYVVFNRAPNETENCPTGAKGGPGFGGTYDNCRAALWIVPSTGGEAIRLDAASGPNEEGNGNSWPSMTDKISGDYYWVAFSSRRPYGLLHNGPTDESEPPGPKPEPLPKEENTPQIWVAAIDPSQIEPGKDPSFAPLWLPGQDLDGGGNHIGQWAVR